MLPKALPRSKGVPMKRIALAVAAFLYAAPSFAQSQGWQCWADASARYNVPVDLLYAIARVETGNRAGLVSRPNKNGSYDIGLMQINSMHLRRLAKNGITERDLLGKPCVNLHVGAMILSEMISRHGYTWVAIGAYNAGSHDKRIIYARKVFAMHDKIVRERGRHNVAATSEQNRQKAEREKRLAELQQQIRLEKRRLAMLDSGSSQENSN